MKKILTFCVLFSLAANLPAQQLADTTWHFVNSKPAYNKNKGSRIWIDEAHYNFHTITGRYAPFAEVLSSDGYIVSGNSSKLSLKNLAGCDVLIIANALNQHNDTAGWDLPNPSFADKSEISAVKTWVKNGGSIFLIADHMPFAGAAYDLAKAFGFEFINGFAMDTLRDLHQFYKANKTLMVNEITNGIDTVVSFTGSAFTIPHGAKPILCLSEQFTVLTPTQAWQFNQSTPNVSGTGLYQGAFLKYGKGKIVVFGEAGMFTAQVSGIYKFGMNHPKANQNVHLLLNIIHWLDPKN